MAKIRFVNEAEVPPTNKPPFHKSMPFYKKRMNYGVKGPLRPSEEVATERARAFAEQEAAQAQKQKERNAAGLKRQDPTELETTRKANADALRQQAGLSVPELPSNVLRKPGAFVPPAVNDPNAVVVPKNSSLLRSPDATAPIPDMYPNADQPLPADTLTKDDVLNLKPGMGEVEFKPEIPSVSSLQTPPGQIDLEQWENMNLKFDESLTDEQALQILSKYTNKDIEVVVKDVQEKVNKATNREELDTIFSKAAFTDYSNVEQNYFLSTRGSWKKLKKHYKTIESLKDETKEQDLTVPITPQQEQLVVQMHDKILDGIVHLTEIVDVLYPLYENFVEHEPRFGDVSLDAANDLSIPSPQKDPRANPATSNFEREIFKTHGVSLKDIGLMKTLSGDIESIDFMNNVQNRMHGLLWKEVQNIQKQFKRPEVLGVFLNAIQVLNDPKAAGVTIERNAYDTFNNYENIAKSQLWNHYVGPTIAKNLPKDVSIRQVPALLSFMINDLNGDPDAISQFFTETDIIESAKTLLKTEWIETLESSFYRNDDQIKRLRGELYDNDKVRKEVEKTALRSKIIEDYRTKFPNSDAKEEDIEGTLAYYRKKLFSTDLSLAMAPLLELNNARDNETDPNVKSKIEQQIEKKVLELSQKFTPFASEVYLEISTGRGLDEKTDLLTDLKHNLVKSVRTYATEDGDFAKFLSENLRKTGAKALRKFNFANSNFPAVLINDEQVGQAFDLLLDTADMTLMSRFIGMEMYTPKRNKNTIITKRDSEAGNNRKGFQARFLQNEKGDEPQPQFKKTNRIQVEAVLKGSGILKNPDRMANFMLNLMSSFETAQSATDVFMPLSKLLNLTHMTNENDKGASLEAGPKKQDGSREVASVTQALGKKASYQAILDYVTEKAGLFEPTSIDDDGDKVRSQGPSPSFQTKLDSGRKTTNVLINKKYMKEFVSALFDGRERDAYFALEGTRSKSDFKKIPKTLLKYDQTIFEIAQAVITSIAPDILKATLNANEKIANYNAKMITMQDEKHEEKKAIQREKIVEKMSKMTKQLRRLAAEAKHNVAGTQEKYNEKTKKIYDLTKEMDDVNFSKPGKAREMGRDYAIKQALSTHLSDKMVDLGPSAKLALSPAYDSPSRLLDGVMSVLLQVFTGAAYSARPTIGKSKNDDFSANVGGLSTDSGGYEGSPLYLEDKELEKAKAKIASILGQSDQESADPSIDAILSKYPNAKKAGKYLLNVIGRNSDISGDVKEIARKAIIETIYNYAHDRQTGKIEQHPKDLLRTLSMKIDNNIKSAFKNYIGHMRFGNTNITHNTMSTLWHRIQTFLHLKAFPLNLSLDGEDIVNSFMSTPEIGDEVTQLIYDHLMKWYEKKIVPIESEKDRLRIFANYQVSIDKLARQIQAADLADTRTISKLESEIEKIEYERDKKSYLEPDQIRAYVKKEQEEVVKYLPTWINIETKFYSSNQVSKEEVTFDNKHDGVNGGFDTDGAALAAIQGLQKFVLNRTFKPITNDSQTAYNQIKSLEKELEKELKTPNYQPITNNKAPRGTTNPEILEIENELIHFRRTLIVTQDKISSNVNKGLDDYNQVLLKTVQETEAKIAQLMHTLSLKNKEEGVQEPSLGRVSSAREQDLRVQLNNLRNKMVQSAGPENPSVTKVNNFLARMKSRIQDAVVRSTSLAPEIQHNQQRRKTLTQALETAQGPERQALNKELMAVSKKLKGKAIDHRRMINIKEIAGEFRELNKLLEGDKHAQKMAGMKFFEFYYILTKMMGVAILSITDVKDESNIATTIGGLMEQEVLSIYIDPDVWANDIMKINSRTIIDRYRLKIDVELANQLVNYMQGAYSLDPLEDQRKKQEKIDRGAAKKAGIKYQPTSGKTNQTQDGPAADTSGGLAFAGDKERTVSTGNSAELSQDKSIERQMFSTMGFENPFRIVTEYVERRKVKPEGVAAAIARDDERNLNLDDGLPEEELDVETIRKGENLTTSASQMKLLDELIQTDSTTLNVNSGEIYINQSKRLLKVLVASNPDSENIKTLADYILVNQDLSQNLAYRINRCKSVLTKIKTALGKDVAPVAPVTTETPETTQAVDSPVESIQQQIDTIRDDMKRTNNAKTLRYLQVKLKELEAQKDVKPVTKFVSKPTKPGKGKKIKKIKEMMEQIQDKILNELQMMEPNNTFQSPFARIIEMIEQGKMPQGSLKVTSLYLKKFKHDKFRQLESMKNSCKGAVRRSNVGDGMFKFGQYNVYVNESFDQYIIEKDDPQVKGESINFLIPKSTLHI